MSEKDDLALIKLAALIAMRRGTLPMASIARLANVSLATAYRMGGFVHDPHGTIVR